MTATVIPFPVIALRMADHVEGLCDPGLAIAQSRAAVEFLQNHAKRRITAGINGCVYIFADKSALMTSNDAVVIWPRWVV